MTFSIVARDPTTGAFGAATATGGPCVGALVPHVAGGVGAVATQGDTNPYYGIDGVSLLKAGELPKVIIERIISPDPGRGRRQMIAIGRDGPPSAFSGDGLEATSGTRAGKNYAIAGNMLAGAAVLDDMAQAFDTGSGLLEDRLLAALAAGQAAGGDKRGTRSAALLVYGEPAYARLDCRVDYSQSPVDDLFDLVELNRNGPYAEFLAGRPVRQT
jgi:uncharacterized Ntn-hydrolase superfamily protein